MGYLAEFKIGTERKEPTESTLLAYKLARISSHQFNVCNGDSIFTKRLKFCEVNDKVVHRLKCVVRVVASCPWQGEYLRSPLDGHYRIRLTLNDLTARVHAYIISEDGVNFFGGNPTDKELIKKMSKLPLTDLVGLIYSARVTPDYSPHAIAFQDSIHGANELSSLPRVDSMRSMTDAPLFGSLSRFDSMQSRADHPPLGSLARFDSIRSRLAARLNMVGVSYHLMMSTHLARLDHLSPQKAISKTK